MNKLMTTVLMILVAQAAQSAQVYSGTLPPLPAGQNVSIEEVAVAPGAVVPAHRHNAHVYVYVLEGAVDMQVNGGEVQHLTPGQVFVETPEDVHTLMKNPSSTEDARFVAFIVKAEDAKFELVGREAP